MALTLTATLPTYDQRVARAGLVPADLLKAPGPLPVTDGESISPESHRSSGSGPDGLRVVYDHARVDPDAYGSTAGMFRG